MHKEFRSVALFGAGYDADAVDDLLDRIAVQLREYEPGAQLRAEQERQDERDVRGMLEKAQQELRETRGEA
ncbi:DivIVA domain-containing protein [Microbacterium arabinogalactanolyticum]